MANGLLDAFWERSHDPLPNLPFTGNLGLLDALSVSGLIPQIRKGDLVPGLGQAMAVEDIRNAMNEGQTGSAAVQGGLLAADVLPMGKAAGLLAAPVVEFMRRGPLADAPKVGAGAQGGWISYHGTPHKVDKFRMSKIGTGEGAQAYGHGLYFAENPDVAGEYRANVIGKGAISVGGEKITPSNHNISLIVANNRDDFAKMRSDLEGYIEKYADNPYAGTDEAKTIVSAIDKGELGEIGKGNLYTVDINDAIKDKMLDWDAPLSEQTDVVKNILRNEKLKIRSTTADNWLAVIEHVGLDKTMLGTEPDGADIYKAVKLMFDTPSKKTASMMGELGIDPYGAEASSFTSEELASKWLKHKGIPGLRYFDAGSRGTSEGTRNFVVWDEDQIKILKENDKPVKDAFHDERAAEKIPVYRGLLEEYDPKKNKHVIWTSTDPKYASQYAEQADVGGNVMPITASVSNPADLGFRSSMTDVRLEDVADRVRSRVLDAFKQKRIDRDTAMRLADKVGELTRTDDGVMRPVYEWWNNTPEIAEILKEARYDALKAREGANDDVITYGLFSPSQMGLLSQ